MPVRWRKLPGPRLKQGRAPRGVSCWVRALSFSSDLAECELSTWSSSYWRPKPCNGYTHQQLCLHFKNVFCTGDGIRYESPLYSILPGYTFVTATLFSFFAPSTRKNYFLICGPKDSNFSMLSQDAHRIS
jgi:hypothetical protein